MSLLKHRSRVFYIGCALLVAIAICGSVKVYARSGPHSKVAATVRGGSLTESMGTNRVKLDVDKKVRLASYSLLMVVTDARGTGGGWHLSITSTTFKITHDKDKGKDRLPNYASRVGTVSIACAANSTCKKPINRISYPLFVPADETPPPPVKFFDAAKNSGLGEFDLGLFVNVSIPNDTEPGIYSSTVILTIANGP